jgi:transformer-2 protein
LKKIKNLQINKFFKISKFYKLFKTPQIHSKIFQNFISYSKLIFKSGNVCYISNLSKRIKDEEIMERFSKYGKVVDVRVVRDPFTKDSRGFGFVTMESAKEAEEVIENLNKTEFDDKQISVEISKRSRPHHTTPGVYLGPSNISSSRRPPRNYSPRRRYRSRSRSRSKSYNKEKYYKRQRYNYNIMKFK